MTLSPARCGTWNWKCKPRVGNGCAEGWRTSSKPKPATTAEFFPQSGRKAHHRRAVPLRLRTAFGLVVLQVWRGQDPAEGHWGCPMRERWGLSAHQQLSPALEDKLAYFGTVTVSHEAAARLAAKVGIGVEGTTIRAVVQRLGAKAQAQVQTRLTQPPAGRAWESDPARTKLFCRTCPADELSGGGAAGPAHCQWRGGVRLSESPMSAETTRPVLDAHRFTSSGCVRRSPRSWPLG